METTLTPRLEIATRLLSGLLAGPGYAEQAAEATEDGAFEILVHNTVIDALCIADELIATEAGTPAKA